MLSVSVRAAPSAGHFAARTIGKKMAMRSTIVFGLACTLILPAPALAAGCYAQHYSAAHLAAHPDQVVASIQFRIGKDKFGSGLAAVMRVAAADQGRVRAQGHGGKSFIQTFSCYSDARGRLNCDADCDSGKILIPREDGKVLEFHTSALMMTGTDNLDDNDRCTFSIDLAEKPREETTYRLTRAPDAACKGLW
jgi:hypothetical protein